MVLKMVSPTHSKTSVEMRETTYSIRRRDVSDPDEKHDSERAMTDELISAGSQHLQRKLGGKEIQLFAVGGAIGTCMMPAVDVIFREMFDLLLDGSRC